MLKDPKLQSQLDTLGYVRFQLLNTEGVQTLLDLYQSVVSGRPNDQKGCHVSLLDTDKNRVKATFQSMLRLTKSSFDACLSDDAKFISGGFLSKNARDAESAVYPHKDWSVVDEEVWASYNVWIPLVDTNEENGRLGFIEGTHKKFRHIRGSPGQTFPRPLEVHKELLFSQMEFVDMKAGEAFLYNHALIHGSYPNRSSKNRPVAVMALTQKQAPLWHYYLMPKKNKELHVQKYLIENDFYLCMDPLELWKMNCQGKTPEGHPLCTLLDSFPYVAPTYESHEIVSALHRR